MSKLKHSISSLNTRLPVFSLYIFFGLLAYMPLHILVSTWFGTSFGLLEPAKVAKDILMIIGFMPFLVASYKSVINLIKSDRLIMLILAYGLLSLGMAVIRSTDTASEVLGVVYNLRFLIFLIYGLLLTNYFKPKWLIKRSIQIVMTTALLVMIFGVIQYLWLPDSALVKIGYSRQNGVLPTFHIDDKPDLERTMSTLRDPNSYGSYLIIILSISFVYFWLSRNKDIKQMNGGLLALSVINLWYTFSRSAWIGAMIAVATILFIVYLMNRKAKAKPRLKYKYYWIVLIPIIMLLGTVYTMRDSYFVRNVIMHSDEATIQEDPNQLRIRFWQESVRSAIENPLGHGPGTAGIVSIRNHKQGTVLNENYYLQILYEVGVIGLILFILILVLMGQRLLKLAKKNDYIAIALFASLLGLIFTNLLVHIWSNEAVAYTWWGLAGLAVFQNFRKIKARDNV